MARKSNVLERGSDYYKQGEIQPIQFMFENGIGVNFCVGNIIKYMTRFLFREDPMGDLVKARHYVDLLIDHFEKRGFEDEGE